LTLDLLATDCPVNEEKGIDMSDRIKAIEREYPSRIPVSASILPSAWIKHREALDEIASCANIQPGPKWRME